MRARVAVGRFAGLVIVALSSAGLGGCSQDRDPFYDTPPDLLGGQAGKVLRSEVVAGLPTGMRGWRILYQSTGLDGRPVAVSGTLVRPDSPAPPGGFPVVSEAHPTVGIADACAPSLGHDLGVATGAAVSAGFAVVLSDYEGLGTDGIHPYLVGESEARSVLDAARAARSLAEAEVSNVVGLFGYSQGGHAVMFAAERAGSYAPDLRVVGAVSLAGVASDRWVADVLTNPALYALGVMAVVAWSETSGSRSETSGSQSETSGDTLRVEEVLGPVGRTGVARLTGADVGRPRVCSDLGGIGVGHQSSELVVADPRTLPNWRAALERNAVGASAPDAPLLLFAGGADNVVPASEAEYALERYCASGAVVERRLVAGADHLSVSGRGVPAGIDWLSDRVAGRRAASSCRG